MASSLPPPKGVAFTFYMALVSQADTDTFKTSVTLATGDVKVSLDGAAFANVATLPTEIGTSGVLSCHLSAAEMNADVVIVKFTDAAGSEWQDGLVTIYTTEATFDTIFPAAAAGASGGLPVLDSNLASAANVTYSAGVAVTSRLAQQSDLPAAAPSVVEVDSQLSATHGAGLWGGANSGASAITYTVLVDGVPTAGIFCRMTTDAAGLVNVDAGTTNALGRVTFHHDLPSGTTVYIHPFKIGVQFSVDTEVIP